MRITHIELGVSRVPLKLPFRTALRSVDQVEDVIVRLHTDSGHVGYGAAPPTAAITGDTLDSIVAAIRQHIAPHLIGGEVAELDQLTALIREAVPGNPSAKAAMDIAVHDLWGQWQGAPLYRLFGGSHPRLRTDLTISVGEVSAMVEQSLHAVGRGYRALKLKLGKDPALDIRRVLAIHEAVGDRATLRLDANQGWSAEQAVQVLQAVEHAGVQPELLEQPVPANDIDGLCHVTARVQTPVVADESVFDANDAIEVIRRRAADIINIKLMKAGGISGALRIADLAAAHGVGCMIGCMLEGAVGVTAAAHVAAARPEVITKIDLDGPALCRYNPVDGGAIFREAEIDLTDGPGLGIRDIRDVERLDY
ncbi:dipeptide epimerase [Dyella solisilvae]|uniref:Dipeptide epimerase n=1 Tax=Dyella solisilvae TaxID=1920168 RepID=A0A370K7V3_9GAMM|nr:dipeptide epimerase [Dyella solisilvae]RDI98517.1 dipeptide epimerase [Dyella solisilvae]